MKINPSWQNEIMSSILQNKKIDSTITFTAAAKWLVAILAKHGVPFKIHKLGLGVVRITTDCDTCPCCGKKI